MMMDVGDVSVVFVSILYFSFCKHCCCYCRQEFEKVHYYLSSFFELSPVAVVVKSKTETVAASCGSRWGFDLKFMTTTGEYKFI